MLSVVKLGRNRWLGAFCVAASVLTASCSSDSTTAAKSTSLRGYIDFPKPGASFTGKFSSFGWAVSEDGIKGVSGTIDRKYPMACTYGTSRPDVNKAVPGFPSGDNPGWNCEIDAAGLPPGNHELSVQSESNKGLTRVLGSVPIVVTH